MSRISLSKEDLVKIKEATREAESKTSGEIATAFIRESDSYAYYEMLFAFFCGFIYFVGMMMIAQRLEHLMQEIFWGYNSAYLVMFYGFTTFTVMAFAYMMANVQFVDRLIIPKAVMRLKVNQRATRYFLESGVLNTRDRSGILIFISELERRVELVADKGISAKIPPDKWEYIVAHIIDGIHANEFPKHLVEGIRECGTLLAEHFPIQPGDVNELKDDLHLLAR